MLLINLLCSQGHDGFMLAERTVAWFGWSQIKLDPRSCMAGNSKAGFSAIALHRSSHTCRPWLLPLVDPWPVRPGEPLQALVHGSMPATLFAIARAFLFGNAITNRVSLIACSCEGPTLRFKTTMKLPSFARGAPITREHGEWVALM